MKAQRGPAVFTLNSTKSTTIDTPFGNMTFLVVMLLLLILDMFAVVRGWARIQVPKKCHKKAIVSKNCVKIFVLRH